MEETTNWQTDLKVTHPSFNEPEEMREARVLRRLSAFLSVNSADIDDKVLGKCEKAINVRMLNIMDVLRAESE